MSTGTSVRCTDVRFFVFRSSSQHDDRREPNRGQYRENERILVESENVDMGVRHRDHAADLIVGRKSAFVRLMNDEGTRKGPRMRWLVDRYGRRLFEM